MSAARIEACLVTSLDTLYTCNCLHRSAGTAATLLVAMYQHQQETRIGAIAEAVVGPERKESTLRLLTEDPQGGEERFPGVFDITALSSSSEERCPLVVVSCTDGTVRLLELEETSGASSTLKARAACTVVPNTIVTSCCCVNNSNNGERPENYREEQTLVAALHGGQLAMLNLCLSESDFSVVSVWEAHEFDAWCVSSCSQSGGGAVVLSGGDDAKMCLWDLRCAASVGTRCRPQQTASFFDAGVVSINALLPPSPNAETTSASHENVLLVGSYDEKLYAVDVRMLKREISSVRLGGGVWRVRQVRSDGGNDDGVLCFAAAMQAGVQVATFNAATSSFEHLGGFHQTDSETGSEVLVYDVSVRRKQSQLRDSVAAGESEEDKKTMLEVASCSFYNRSVKLWDVTIS